jgi:hypothetical protein
MKRAKLHDFKLRNKPNNLQTKMCKTSPKLGFNPYGTFCRSTHILAAKAVLERDKNITYNDNFLQPPTQADKKKGKRKNGKNTSGM